MNERNPSRGRESNEATCRGRHFLPLLRDVEVARWLPEAESKLPATTR
jgi:hypothetical protein